MKRVSKLVFSKLLFVVFFVLFAHSTSITVDADSAGGGAGRKIITDELLRLIEDGCQNDITFTTASGSKVIVPGGNKNYGSCHIYYRHMLIPSVENSKVTNVGPTPWVDASQFSRRYSNTLLRNILKYVFDNQLTQVPVPNQPGRSTKEIYVPTEGRKVRVVYSRSATWPQYKDKYNIVVISAFPNFGNASFKRSIVNF